MQAKTKKNGTVAAGIIVAALLVFGGCVQGLKGLKFSHQDHAKEAACADCHGDAARAGHAACLECHEIDQDKPSEACLTCHTEGDYRVQSKRPDSYADVTFDHSSHRDEECGVCHAGASRSRKAGDQDFPGMAVCMNCHDGEQAPAECATCHTKLSKDVAPDDHTSTWLTVHGPVAQTDRVTCAYCHIETGCEDCHKIRRPRSHTPGWKNSGHGIAAGHDRQPCATCHQADECSRCHRLQPSSHYGAQFRIPLNDQEGHAALVQQRGTTRSCRVCHEASFCAACHN